MDVKQLTVYEKDYTRLKALFKLEAEGDGGQEARALSSPRYFERAVQYLEGAMNNEARTRYEQILQEQANA